MVGNRRGEPFTGADLREAAPRQLLENQACNAYCRRTLCTCEQKVLDSAGFFDSRILTETQFGFWAVAQICGG